MKSLLVAKKIWPIRNIRDEQMFLESPSKLFFFSFFFFLKGPLLSKQCFPNVKQPSKI